MDINNNCKNHIICEEICFNCNTHFIKDPLCGGDYHPLESGFMVLMKFCPNCGVMLPYVSIHRQPDPISNNSKKRIAVRVATAYDRGYRELKNIANDLRDVKNHGAFIRQFARRAELTVDEVLVCCF